MLIRDRVTYYTLLDAGLCLVGAPALVQKAYDPGVSDTEIKLGQTAPYSGPLSGYHEV